MKSIKLYWYRADPNDFNFGDLLSPFIVELLSGRPVSWSRPATCDLLAIGSLLDGAISRRWQRAIHHPFRRTKVWGSGSFGLRPGTKWHNLEIHAVRGPRTRDSYGLPAGTPIGDPAVLVPLYLQKIQPSNRWGIIPHVFDRMNPIIQAMKNETDRSIIIDVGSRDVVATAMQIASCDFVVSSSLHGLIVADAFGVPNVWMTLGNLVGGHWKFIDYLDSVERQNQAATAPTTVSLRELESTATVAAQSIVSRLQRGLIEAFNGIGL
jgi:pyruvyltransferase